MIPWNDFGVVSFAVAVVAAAVAVDQYLTKLDVVRDRDAAAEDLIAARRTIADLAEKVARLRFAAIGSHLRRGLGQDDAQEATQKPVGAADGDFRYDVPSDTLEPAVAALSPNARVIHASDPENRDVNGFFEQRERARAGIAPRDGKGKFCRVSAPVAVDRINREDHKDGWS